MKNVNNVSVIASVLNNSVSTKEETMKNQEFIMKWYEENGHLLESEITEVDYISSADAVLIKEHIYNVEGAMTGRRNAPKYKQYEESSHVSKSDMVADEYVVDFWYDEHGNERKEYDNGGSFGEQFKRHQESITTGEYSKHFRNSHFEDGLMPGQFHAVDERGNLLGFLSTAEYKSWERQVKAEITADVEFLAARYERRRSVEVEMRDYARSVYAMIYKRILNHKGGYGEIKDLIYRSQSIVLKALKRRYPEKITKGGAIFIYGPVKYGTNGANLTNMNILFHKTESSKLWKAVDESNWKKGHVAKLESARDKYNKLMGALSITNNPYDQADLITTHKVALSKADAQAVLNYVGSKSNPDRLNYQVYQAVRQLAA